VAPAKTDLRQMAANRRSRMNKSEEDRRFDFLGEGLVVRALGRACGDNPYPRGSKEAFLWEKGWRLIDERREGVSQMRDATRAPSSNRGCSTKSGAPSASFVQRLRDYAEAFLPLALIMALIAVAIFKT
jgi:hypothetical protein